MQDLTKEIRFGFGLVGARVPFPTDSAAKIVDLNDVVTNLSVCSLLPTHSVFTLDLIYLRMIRATGVEFIMSHLCSRTLYERYN